MPSPSLSLVFDVAGAAPGLRQRQPQRSFAPTEIWKSSAGGTEQQKNIYRQEGDLVSPHPLAG